MSSNAEPLLLEKITYYRDAEVIAITPQGGPSILFKEKAVVDQFLELEKKLKAEADLSEPVLFGDKACALAPSLTIDRISGPVYWDEIVKLEA